MTSAVKRLTVLQRDGHGYGWVRLWPDGPGIAWKPASAPLVFSERHGYTLSLRLGRWRFKYLPRWRSLS